MYFPLREYSAAVRLTLAEPTVILKRGADNLQLDIPLVASISGEGQRRGRLVVDIGLHYKASTGELFLGTPRIRDFKMQDISDEYRKVFHDRLADVLQTTLPLVRIYRLHEKDLNHSLSMSKLKSLHIEDGRVRVSIGFN